MFLLNQISLMDIYLTNNVCADIKNSNKRWYIFLLDAHKNLSVLATTSTPFGLMSYNQDDQH